MSVQTRVSALALLLLLLAGVASGCGGDSSDTPTAIATTSTPSFTPTPTPTEDPTLDTQLEQDDTSGSEGASQPNSVTVLVEGRDGTDLVTYDATSGTELARSTFGELRNVPGPENAEGITGSFDAEIGNGGYGNCSTSFDADFTHVIGIDKYGQSDAVPALLDLETGVVENLIEPPDHSGFEAVPIARFAAPSFRPQDDRPFALKADQSRGSAIWDLAANRKVSSFESGLSSWEFGYSALGSKPEFWVFMKGQDVRCQFTRDYGARTNWSIDDRARRSSDGKGRSAAFTAQDSQGGRHLMIWTGTKIQDVSVIDSGDDVFGITVVRYNR